jgi:hypothetical protein
MNDATKKSKKKERSRMGGNPTVCAFRGMTFLPWGIAARWYHKYTALVNIVKCSTYCLVGGCLAAAHSTIHIGVDGLCTRPCSRKLMGRTLVISKFGQPEGPPTPV